jgi:hypothetical protein
MTRVWRHESFLSVWAGDTTSALGAWIEAIGGLLSALLVLFSRLLTIREVSAGTERPS